MVFNYCYFHSLSRDSLGLSDEVNLVYRLLNVWQFSSVTTADAQKLLLVGLSCMNSAFAMVCNCYGGTPQGASSGNVSAPHGQTSSSGGSSGQTATVAGQSSLSTANSVSPTQNDIDYQTALMIVAEAIWIQKRIVKILLDDPSSPQGVSFHFFGNVYWFLFLT